MVMCMLQRYSLTLSQLLLPPQRPQVCSLGLCLYSCPANRKTMFLYTHRHMLACTHVHDHMCTCVHTHAHRHMYAHFVHVCAHMYMHTQACVCIYCCLVTQSCPTLCNPMDFSAPGLPVPHHLPKFAQVHVRCISDAIQH